MSCLAHAAKELRCNSHRSSRRSIVRRHPIVSIAGGLVTAAALVFVLSSMPDIVRYIKISRM